MLGFGSLIRPYMARQLREVAAALRVTERDMEILDFVASKGTTNFAEIAKQMRLDEKPGTSATRVSTALSALYGKHGLIDMKVNPDDRRRPLVSLTTKGKRVVKETAGIREAVYERIRMAMNLTSDEVSMLQAIFERAGDNFRQFLAQKTE